MNRAYRYPISSSTKRRKRSGSARGKGRGCHLVLALLPSLSSLPGDPGPPSSPFPCPLHGARRWRSSFSNDGNSPSPSPLAPAEARDGSTRVCGCECECECECREAHRAHPPARMARASSSWWLSIRDSFGTSRSVGEGEDGEGGRRSVSRMVPAPDPVQSRAMGHGSGQ